MTHKELALAEMRRVLKPGGKLMVLEFSKVWKPLRRPTTWYSFKLLPRMGDLVTKDADSYRYLAESIRMHPDQARRLGGGKASSDDPAQRRTGARLRAVRAVHNLRQRRRNPGAPWWRAGRGSGTGLAGKFADRRRRCRASTAPIMWATMLRPGHGSAAPRHSTRPSRPAAA
jgi:hypothetical protein